MLLARSVVLLCAVTAVTAQAGRPLAVDDADVDDKGTGHVEAWYARQPGKADTWTVAPAFAPIDNLELSAQVSRDTSAALTTQTLQAKWRITPAQESGCNVGATLGVSRIRTLGGDAPYLNGLLTCQMKQGAVHLNAGWVRPTGGPGVPTWGAAYERNAGSVGWHVEAFGQRGARPTFQAGLKTQLTPRFQLDGSVGRNHGETLFSIGVKADF